MKKALAVIRTDNMRGCPFGLDPISSVCRHVGKGIYNMQVLEDVPFEQREKYAKANRKAYRHLMDGTRCPFADKFIEGRDDIVNCDYGENGAGEHEQAFRGSPFYPRVFQGLNDSIYTYPVGNYTDNSGANQLFSGLFSMYASTGEVNMKKTSNFTPDANLYALYYELKDSFLAPTSGNLEDSNGNH